jgi:hypothetical protein
MEVHSPNLLFLDLGGAVGPNTTSNSSNSTPDRLHPSYGVELHYVLWIHVKHDLSLDPTGSGTDPVPASRRDIRKMQSRVVYVIETSRSWIVTADAGGLFALLASSDWSTSAIQVSRQLAIELAIFLQFELQKIKN